MAIEEELYKSLIDESKLYREKVVAVWLHKFAMLGAIIAFAVTQSQVQKANADLVVAAILTLPIIALLLDIKLTEFGIHANVIDHFIIRHFPEPSVVQAWEKTKWGISDSQSDNRLTHIRTIATLLVTMIPTCLIGWISTIAIKPYASPVTISVVRSIALIMCFIYVTSGFLIFWYVAQRKQHT